MAYFVTISNVSKILLSTLEKVNRFVYNADTRRRKIMKLQQQNILNNWWCLHLSAGGFCWREF